MFHEYFSQNAYDMDKELKDESLALIDKAKDRTAYTSVADNVSGASRKANAGSMQIEKFGDSVFQITVNAAVTAIAAAA